MTEQGQQRERHSVRLIFEYDGDDVRLLQQQAVDVAISGFDLPQELLPGDVVEVRGTDEHVLSRTPVRAPMDTSVEVFPENPDDPITRTELPQARGAFTVVVPVGPLADHVTVVRVPAPSGATEADVAEARAVELGSFPLEDGDSR